MRGVIAKGNLKPNSAASSRSMVSQAEKLAGNAEPVVVSVVTDKR